MTPSTRARSTLADVLARARASAVDGIWQAMPGIVTRYDAAAQIADVQPAVKVYYRDEDGEPVAETLPVVIDCPVVFPGAGAFALYFPITAGDSCLLLASSVAIDRWQSVGKVVDPGDPRRHSLGDMFVIPGLRSVKGALASHPAYMHVGRDSGPHIEIDGSEVRVRDGGTAVSLALKSDVQSLVTTFNAHTHPSNGSPPSTPASSPSGTTVLKGE